LVVSSEHKTNISVIRTTPFLQELVQFQSGALGRTKEDSVIAGRGHPAQQVVGKLREAEVHLSKATSIE
jgi:hypothetical protein